MQRATIIVPTSHPDAQYYVEQVQRQFANELGGYSAYEGDGGWFDGSGDLIEEPHVRITGVGNFTKEWLNERADYVKNGLDEDSVITMIEDVDVTFV